MLMSSGEAEKRGLEPLCRVVSSATGQVDLPMGTGPVPAVRSALEGWLECGRRGPELNEASQPQAVAVRRELAVQMKVNVNGGSMFTLGHPISEPPAPGSSSRWCT